MSEMPVCLVAVGDQHAAAVMNLLHRALDRAELGRVGLVLDGVNQRVTTNARRIGIGKQSQPNSLRSDCCDQTARSHDVYDAGEIIGEHVQCHLGGHARQRLHYEVGCSDPGLDRAEGMLDRLAMPTHGLRILVEPPLHSLQHMLVLPPCDLRGVFTQPGSGAGPRHGPAGHASDSRRI